MTNKQRLVIILILGMHSAIGPFSIDMYLPGFPAIAANLHTSVEAIAYSLSSFFVGICIGQLICGPLLDRYGRKNPLLIGLIIYVLASIGCALSNSIEMLVIMRFFQAIGCCVTMVAPRAIVRDLFLPEENAKIISLLILILGVSPLLAPTTGSFIVAHMGWHWIFILLAIISAAAFVATILWLPESRKPDPTFSLKAKPILASFGLVLKHPQFYTYTFSSAVSFAGLFAYISGSPFVFIELYKVSEIGYGWIFAIIAAGFIGSSQLNNLLMKKYSSGQIVNIMMVAQTIIGLLFLVAVGNNLLGLYGIIAGIFMYLSCMGFILPNASALAMAPFTREAGSASALMGAVQMGAGAISAAFVSLIADGTAMPMAIIMGACATFALIILVIGYRKIKCIPTIEESLEGQLDVIEKF